jgi:acyl-CoA synthetase (AMP-forming)/AMP-acid ligase II
MLRSFFAERWPQERLRAAADSAHGHDSQLWKAMAEDLGLHGLAVPEDLGGGGFTYPDLLVAFEEMGRALVAGPFFASVAMASTLLLALPDRDVHERLLLRIAAGERSAIEVFRCDFFNSFGAGTEAAGQTMFYPEDHLRAMAGEEHLLGSIGRPIYGVDLRLCDDELNDVPPGTVGEITTRSETVMSGYLDDPERTTQAVVDGWFRAGDLAWMDEDGFLFLAGRKSDMIIRGGENVYPVEIESVLAEHPSVAAAAVVDRPDEHWGEVVVAAIELRPGHRLDERELSRHCRERLAAYKVPVRFFAMESMPRNVNGKLQKFAVADLIAERYRPAGREPEKAGGGR